MKWIFLILFLVTLLQGSLLSWSRYLELEDVKTASVSPDGSMMSLINYVPAWQVTAAIWISFIVCLFSPLVFLKLNMAVRNRNQELGKTTRPE